MKKWNFSGNFLAEFDTNYAGAIGNIFCQAVRAGAEDADEVLDYVAKHSANRTAQSVYRLLNNSLESIEAREFAEHILWRENLPREVSEKLKNEAKRENLNNLMNVQPPTEKQLSYLKALGCKIEPGSKLEASNLISMLKSA